MTKYEKIPYPTDEEIQQQISNIVKCSLPKQQSILSHIQTAYRHLGWRHLLSNRNEWFFTVIILSIILLLLWVTTIDHPATIKPSYFALLFMVSPIIFASMSIYSFYDKKEHKTYELEMTTKYTVFQLIGLRMLLFSSFAILCNTSFSLWLSHVLNIEFLRIWLLSLTGLFFFAVGLLIVMKSGQVIRKIIIFPIGWIITNSLFIFFANDYSYQLLLQLPIVVYFLIVLGLIGLFCVSFKKVYLRKQEGIWL